MKQKSTIEVDFMLKCSFGSGNIFTFSDVHYHDWIIFVHVYGCRCDNSFTHVPKMSKNKYQPPSQKKRMKQINKYANRMRNIVANANRKKKWEKCYYYESTFICKFFFQLACLLQKLSIQRQTTRLTSCCTRECHIMY